MSCGFGVLILVGVFVGFPGGLPLTVDCSGDELCVWLCLCAAFALDFALADLGLLWFGLFVL